MSISKTILITGANRGIGFGIVQALAQRSEKNNVIVASRKRKDAEDAVEQLQIKGSETPHFYPLELDVSADGSIDKAVAAVEKDFGSLDVLINNAGIALFENADDTDLRTTWSQVLNTNVTSVRIVTELFLPLLRKSKDPRVINISSLRGSFDRVTQGSNPPTASIPYSVSKAAVNMMMIELAKKYTDIDFHAVSPGHCKTAFNGFRGKKDPVDGAKAAVELALAGKGAYDASSFWECEDEGMKVVGW